MRHPKSILQPDAKQDFLWAVMEGMPLGADAWPGSLRDRLLEAWLGWLDGQTEEMEEGGFVPDETEGIF